MEKTFLITAETGIHARPATILVNEAVKFNSQVLIKMADKEVNLKSIMGVMSLGINNGAKVTLTCIGEDEEKAMADLTDTIYKLKLGKED